MKSIFIKILLSSFALWLLISPLRAFDMRYSSLAGFVLYFFFTIFCLYRYGARLSVTFIVGALVAGLWLVQLPMRVSWFKPTMVSLPDGFLQTSGIICGLFYWRLKGVWRFSPVFIGSILVIFMFFFGYGMWVHKLGYGTFTGRIQYLHLPFVFEAKDEELNLITDTELSGKIVLLDFWHTKCGICFEKFPLVQAAYNKYRDDPTIRILAVNKPLEENRQGEAFEMIRAEGYSFQAVISNDERMPENFGVSGYPTTFVIDRKGEVVFKGDIEGAVKMVEELKRAE